MEKLIPLYHPDIIIYGFCQNDFLDNPASEAYGQAKPRFKMMQNGDVKMFPPVLKDKIYSGGSEIQKLTQYMALYRLLQPSILRLRMIINPFKTKYCYVFYYDDNSLRDISWNLFRYLLKRMINGAGESGTQFLFYAYPAFEEVRGPYFKSIEHSIKAKYSKYDRYAVEKKLINISKEDKIAFIPMIDWFLAHHSEGPFRLLPRDPHCNQNGYRLIAARLNDYCSRLAMKKRELAN
jgi:hypothetical protein